MKKKDVFKKYWFPALIGIILIVFIIIFTFNAYQDRPVIKKPVQDADGNYLIYTLNGENFTADELYAKLKPLYSLNTVYTAFEKAVCQEAYKTTKAMESLATNNAQYVLTQSSKEEVAKQMKALGFGGIEGLDDYFIYIQKSQLLRSDFLKAHEAEYVQPYVEKNEPKYLSHILIKVADVKKNKAADGSYTLELHPSAEETKKLQTVLEELKTEPFAKIAKQYSEDGSAKDGGFLGYFDKANTNNYVKEFTDAALALKDNEVSPVVETEFGYHIIKAETKELADLYQDTAFLNAVYGANANLYYKPLLEKAQELKIEITDSELKVQLMQALGQKDGENNHEKD